METKKILGIIFSIVFVCAFAFVLAWGIINFNKVQEGLSGTGIYTEQDLNEAYQDGYDTALTDKDEYDTLINGYRDNITTLQDTISQLNSQITILTKNNKDYISAITDLEEVKTQNEQTILNLETEIESNGSTISLLESDKLELQSQVTNLEEQIVERNNKITELVESITSLEEEKEDLVIALNTSEENRAELEIEIAGLKEKISILESEKTSLINQNNILSNQVASLNIQIDNLEELNSQLESINSANVTTITSLNSQIQTLNTQISDLIFASQNSTSIITSLQSQVSNLQESISYYQQVINGLIGENQVAVTFEFDGATYNIQVINTGSTANVANPVSTEYVIFNFWTVNGVRIDLSTYTFTENTKVIADVTYRYKVTYLVGDEEFDTQIVTKDEFATLPSDPEKEGYEFDGWSLDGITVVNNITTSPVLAHTTYKAVFTKIHTVTFMVEDEIEDTQTIRNGEYAVSINVEDTEYRLFNGWLLNGSLVNISSQKIVSDTIFRASFTYKYDVYFVVDGEEYNSQIVTSGSYATIPASPTKTGYTFKGWSLSESGTIVSINTQLITGETTFYAIFEIQTFTATFIVEDNVYDTQVVEYNSFANLVSTPNVLDSTFYGWYVNGELVEYSTYPIIENTTFIASFTRDYTWEEMTWNGFSDFYGSEVWSDGENYYITDSISTSYVLDSSTYTWNTVEISYPSDFSHFFADYVWSDGVNTYYSTGGSKGNTQLIFNSETLSWESITWNGLSLILGERIVTINNNYYFCSSDGYCYVLDSQTKTWTSVAYWGSDFLLGYVWSDGNNYYYSHAYNQYILDIDTFTWEPFTWNIDAIIGLNVWSDGKNYYIDDEYILDIETQTWEEITWNGDFVAHDGKRVWTDGVNIYFSYGNSSKQYILL